MRVCEGVRVCEGARVPRTRGPCEGEAVHHGVLQKLRTSLIIIINCDTPRRVRCRVTDSVWGRGVIRVRIRGRVRSRCFSRLGSCARHDIQSPSRQPSLG